MRLSRPLAFTFVAFAAGCPLVPKGGSGSEPPTTSTTSSGSGTAGSGGAAVVDPAGTPLVCSSIFADTPASSSSGAKASWARVLPGSAGEHARFKLGIDGEGNTIATNQFLDTIDFGAGVTLTASSETIFGEYVAKFSRDGDVLWAQETYPFGADDLSVGASGSFWTAGFTKGPTGGYRVRRWDPLGAVMWEKAFNQRVGVTIPDDGDRVIATFDLGAEELDYGTGKLGKPVGVARDAGVIGMDPSGNVIWARSLDSVLWPSATSPAHANNVLRGAPVAGGGAILLAETNPTAGTDGPEDGLSLVRMSALGDVMWVRHFPPVKNGVRVVAVSGPEGQTLLQATLGLDDTIDIGCGPVSGNAIVLAKIAADGSSEWTRTFPGFTTLLKSSFDPRGNIVLTGLAGPPCDLGGGEFVPEIDNQYHGPLVVAELGPDGGHLQSKLVGGTLWGDGGDDLFPLVGAQGELTFASAQQSLDTGLGVGPFPGNWAFLAKIEW